MSGPTFAHLSDLHLPFEPRLTLLQRLSKRQLSAWSWQRRKHLHQGGILEALVADLREHPVDHVVVTGDLTNFSLPQEFEQAARWLEALRPADETSIVPGNHDALVAVAEGEGVARWQRWTRAGEGWPFVHRLGDVSLIGLNSALPTAPLLARGELGPEQLDRLERVLVAEGEARRTRIVALHHPPAEGAVHRRKALADRAELRAVLRRAGAELVLHGHARDARLDALPGPQQPIPCLCVPSSSAVPNPSDQGARWHRLRFADDAAGGERRVEVEVRRWSVEASGFVSAARYALLLPRAPFVPGGANGVKMAPARRPCATTGNPGATMANATEDKFGDPDTRIAQTARWTVLLRPKQPTLGSLALVCREPAEAFGALSAEAFAELREVIGRVEAMLKAVVGYQRINYLMLMMVDRDVHFHVIPRYEGSRPFAGHDFVDAGWPGQPALEPSVSLDPALREALATALRAAWAGAA